MQKIGLGGSCHWCTEAIFRSLYGVTTVEQGWITSSDDHNTPSEAVIVNFEQDKISLAMLVAIHLHTHSCTANHTMRGKYRSAVYTFDDEQAKATKDILREQQADFNDPIITKVLPFALFILNEESYLDYYYKNPLKPFCQNVVNPKLRALLARFSKSVAPGRLHHLQGL